MRRHDPQIGHDAVSLDIIGDFLAMLHIRRRPHDNHDVAIFHKPFLDEIVRHAGVDGQGIVRLQLAAGHHLINFLIAARGFLHHVFGQRHWIFVIDLMIQQPLPDVFFINLLDVLAVRVIIFDAPETGRIGRVNFVNQHDFAVNQAEFVFRVHKNNPAFFQKMRAEREKLQRGLFHACVGFGIHPAFAHEVRRADFAVALFFRRRRDNRLREALVARHAVGNGDAGKFALPFLIAAPHRAGQIAAHDHFHANRHGFAHQRDIRINRLEKMIVDDVPRFLEPEIRNAVQHRAFVRNRRF